MLKYAGVVVLYYPQSDVWDNIQSYLDQIDMLYLMDNSPEKSKTMLHNLEQCEKCKYVSMGENQGLVIALDKGIQMATEDGYDYVLTMDQDSVFDEGAVATMIDKIEQSDEHYAIVAPNIVSLYSNKTGRIQKSDPRMSMHQEKEVNWSITSGSLMNLGDFKKVGGFDPALFIEFVDVDLGVRMQQQHMKILVIGNAVLYQHFGNAKKRKILWKTVFPSYENSSRTYYLFRNYKYMLMKHGKQFKNVTQFSRINHIIKILLFEDRKIEKVSNAIKGHRDGVKGKMGRFIENK